MDDLVFSETSSGFVTRAIWSNLIGLYGFVFRMEGSDWLVCLVVCMERSDWLVWLVVHMEQYDWLVQLRSPY